MKVKWVSQGNPTSAADALEKSIAKWRFFSYCTKKQYDKYNDQRRESCGLCFWYQGKEEPYEHICTKCPFAEQHSLPAGCLTLVQNASGICVSTATLAEFHAAARKVFAKLRSLRKS